MLKKTFFALAAVVAVVAGAGGLTKLKQSRAIES